MEWIRLDDVTSNLDLLFRQARMFGVLFECLVYYWTNGPRVNLEHSSLGLTSSIPGDLQTFRQGLKIFNCLSFWED